MLAFLVGLSGCYTDPGQGTSITHYGNLNSTSGNFTMDGYIEAATAAPSQQRYKNVTVRFYSENNTLIYQERLGTLENGSRLNTSVELTTIPHYVVFDSPDFWEGDTSVAYYIYSSSSNEYTYRDAVNRSELPISPKGQSG